MIGIKSEKKDDWEDEKDNKDRKDKKDRRNEKHENDEDDEGSGKDERIGMVSKRIERRKKNFNDKNEKKLNT